MVQLAAAIAASEPLYVNVLSDEHRRHVAALLDPVVPPERVVLHVVPTNDAWARDHGAIFVTRDHETQPLLALDFEYNAWGGKYPPFDLDNTIPRRMAATLGVPSAWPRRHGARGRLHRRQWRGRGADHRAVPAQPQSQPALTGRHRGCACAASWASAGNLARRRHRRRRHRRPHRRPHALRRRGHRGHRGRAGPGRSQLRAAAADNRERLAAVRLPGGQPAQVIELPMPVPVCAMTASACRPATPISTSANRVVLLPTFDCPADEEAAAILARCFPGRRIVASTAATCWWPRAFHCLTQQVPAAAA
jgi:agmatine deiminase